jgi:hypothetical protein
MSLGRGRSTSHTLPLGVVLATAVILLVFAPAAFAAPKTVPAVAYEVMKKWMQSDDQNGFAKVVDYGGLERYRVRLLQLKMVVDPNLPPSPIDGRPPIAIYDPKTQTLAFLKNPRRKMTAGEREALGKTVWHEVTHALEDKNGDDMYSSDPLYQDRNTYYMELVVTGALPVLNMIEKNAKQGASVKQLRGLWEQYLKQMAAAANLPETRKYKPDLGLMWDWFGFRANPEEIRQLYLSGKALPGPQGENLRQALAPPEVGDPYAGGKVAYIFQSGDPGYVLGQTHGLIAATDDLKGSTSETAAAGFLPWYNGSWVATGATGTALGTGFANTMAIIMAQGEAASSYAAGLARAYSSDGYRDWYLPSKDELNKLFLNRNAINEYGHSFGAESYWSSSEFDESAAWNQGFGSGSQGYYSKASDGKVRPIRSF